MHGARIALCAGMQSDAMRPRIIVVTTMGVMLAAALGACVGDNSTIPDAAVDATADATADAPLETSTGDASDASKVCVLGTSRIGNCTLGP
jgi:hypothetical protein